MVGEDTEFLLAQWALWSRVNPGLTRGYPQRSPFAAPSVPDDLTISDAQAMKIDAAVSLLLQRDRVIGKAMTLYFFYRQNTSKVARRMRTSRRNADKWIAAGIAWVDGALVPEDFFA